MTVVATPEVWREKEWGLRDVGNRGGGLGTGHGLHSSATRALLETAGNSVYLIKG